MMLAITTLLRVSELASIDRQSVVISETKATFVLSKPRKAQRSGSLHSFSLLKFPSDPVICPVDALGHYVYRTDPSRSDLNSRSLFIALRRPFRPVVGATLGRWMKDVMESAGIDTSRFSAHSARGASSSRAARIGVPMDSILGTAHWARESTFTRFYRRDSEGPDFAGAVLAGVSLYSIFSYFVIGALKSQSRS